MTKEAFLSKRFNNALTLGLGLPTVAFCAVALSTALLSDFASFIGVAISGAVY